VTLKNRIVSTGHDTGMTHGGAITSKLIAYHEARAKGGAGLIIVQVASIHETARYSSHVLTAYDDDCIPGYRRLADAVKPHGARIFAQLFHPGREIMEGSDGSLPPAYAPSAVPNERFHVMPVPMSRRLIAEVIAGYGDAARRFETAGIEGAEIVASHGYLPAQFLSPKVNRREDEYGGSLRNRLRFFTEIIADVRAKTRPGFVLGLRISGNDQDADTLGEAAVLEACRELDRGGGLDYFSVVAGTSASLQGAMHIVPPMFCQAAYVAPFGKAMKAVVGKPVLVAGRINQPQIAEKVIAGGEADACGMTRAMIADPRMAVKAEAGTPEDIRACIACNQACIGHWHRGYSISCIQHPETGREEAYGTRKKARKKRSVIVAGGGPAGLKAAAVLAERGHTVTLYEAGRQLGGQVLLAQLLPGRAEFGGLATNLARECEMHDVRIVKGTTVDRALIEREKPDAVIVATGARPRWPEFEGREGTYAVDAWQVLRAEKNIGTKVVIADWRSDWIGVGLAEKLAREGCHVRLMVDAVTSGEQLPWYVRDHMAGVLAKLGVEVRTYARLYGADGRTAYFQHASNGEAIVLDDMDTLVLAHGHERAARLEAELDGWPGEVRVIGDALTPRTAEEAVLEGLKAGVGV
jgi:2,4-dienoyl-CoA reductase-like NADH-dependent reductase (Old Yellow Enzyme family)